MRVPMRRGVWLCAGLAMLIAAVGCGGNGSSGSSRGSVANSVAFVVNSGPANSFANGAFTTITVCVPGSANCTAISGVLIDTGSAGLRILSSAIPSLSLPAENSGSGVALANCIQFADGSFNWGPVRLADVKIAGEQASSVPVQIIGDPAFPSNTVPTNCSSGGGPNNDTLALLGANAILGVGPFLQDCGGACTLAANSPSNPGVYFTCPTPSTCAIASVTLAQQLQNPPSMFAQDNNGVVLQLGQIGSTGTTNAGGTMIFGIGTQSNNGLGSAKIFTTDNSFNICTRFQNTLYMSTFFDSGSNGLFFLNSATAGLPTCTNIAQFGADITSFYCPASTTTLQATNIGAASTNAGTVCNGTSDTFNFTVANGETLFGSGNAVFNDLAGPAPSGTDFDWGMPFFFGRTVFTAFESRLTPGGTGPFFAY